VPTGELGGRLVISIVLPVHNQADHMRNVVEGHLTGLARVPHPIELILVPNACGDDSEAVCAALAAEHPEVRVVPSPKGGWGAAVRCGLAAAQGDLLCYANSARTAPEDLTLLLLYALAYPQAVVKANRKIREGWVRRVGSLLYNLECRTLFDLSNWDINGTPKVFPRGFVKLLAVSRDDDLIDAEFSLICRREGYAIVEVPIFSSRRHGGRSTTNFWSALRLYWGALELWRRVR
jgi:glycosyltransferase involved in cell wall biosynthesis